MSGLRGDFVRLGRDVRRGMLSRRCVPFIWPDSAQMEDIVRKGRMRGGGVIRICLTQKSMWKEIQRMLLLR